MIVKTVVGILAVIGLLAFLGQVAKRSRTPSAPNPSHMRVYCEEAILPRLKTPKTAEFSRGSETSVQEVSPGSAYRLVGHFDAQNSFGAMIRTRYRCDVQTYTSSTERQYSVTSMEFR